MLWPEDAAQLDRVESALRWGRVTHFDSNETVCSRATTIMGEIDNPFLRDIIQDRLELRTVVAALRRRRQGGPAPEPLERWGFGRWTDQIRRNWTDPVFRLERVFPWAAEAGRLLDAEDWLELDKLLLRQVWQDLGRRGEGHHFDFEAVVIYVLKWSLVDRWTGYDAAKASTRFNGLVERAMTAKLPDALGEQLAASR